MKKLSGLISFVGSIAGFVILSYALVRYWWGNQDQYLAIGLAICCVSTTYYTVSTKFWNPNLTVGEGLDRENEIIKKQIEKRELLAKLENLEKK